jgi:aquaporin Z
MVDSVALLAEFLGTFLFILSVFASGGNAYVIGATLAVTILLTAKLSGGHHNPAISLAMYAKGSLGFSELLGYMAAQFAGGLASLYAYRVFA